ncbi:MAG: hypothetical protein WDZ49_10085 [Litorilinea sp.]
MNPSEDHPETQSATRTEPRTEKHTEKRVGLLFGREWSFPPAFVEEINRREAGVSAEYVQLGGIRLDAPCPYDVIVDRISHEVPYYRTYLKQAALQGAYIINNPFLWSADDSFFQTGLAEKLGVAVPRTVLLPMKTYPPGIDEESLRNLEYPLDWQAMLHYVGTPAVLKDVMGGRQYYAVIDSLESLLFAYDHSDGAVMLFQEYIEWDVFVRCLCIGRDNVLPIPFDPDAGVYLVDEPILELALRDRVAHDAQVLSRALGYDMNCIDFAVRNGVPYAIDLFNPAPALDVNILSPYYFDWTVKMMADYVVDVAHAPPPPYDTSPDMPPRCLPS